MAHARAEAIRVDGGMAANDWFCQFLADVLEARVERPARARDHRARRRVPGRDSPPGCGSDLAAVAATWTDRGGVRAENDAARRAALIAGWRHAVSRTLLASPGAS